MDVKKTNRKKIDVQSLVWVRRWEDGIHQVI